MILNATQIGFDHRKWATRSVGCIDLCKKLMDVRDASRIPAETAMFHKWLEQFSHFNVEFNDVK